MAPRQIFVFLASFILSSISTAQCLITGADLSYTNEILKNGGIYLNENGNTVDPFEYFAERETKMVRLRLWHTPSNNIDYCGNEITACSLDDLMEAAMKVKVNGMQLNISIHFSDYFADPGKQKMPLAWEGLTNSTLLDSISNYTYSVLEKLADQNTVPEIISVGNETTWGFIDNSNTTNGFNWNIDGAKFNAAFNAIDLFNQENNLSIKKAVHFTESTALWLADLFKQNGVENFDVIGLSYYPFFSPNTSINEVGAIINELVTDYGKEVMLFETGFVWSNGFADNYNNFMSNNGNVVGYPMTEDGQKEFLIELAEAVIENNGTGIIYWEPSWITSNLCDKWGQGSSYENVSMFDMDTNRPLASFDFFAYCNPTSINDRKNQEEINLKVFPNPLNSNEINIKNVPDDSLWKLFDLSGKIISKGDFDNSKEIQKIIFNQELKGMYLLQLTAKSSKTIIKKLLF